MIITTNLQKAAVQQRPLLLVVQAVHAADLHPLLAESGVVGQVGAAEPRAPAPEQDVAAFAARLPVSGDEALPGPRDAAAAAGRRQTDGAQLDPQLQIRPCRRGADRLLAARRGHGRTHGVGLQPQRDLELVVLDELLQLVDVPDRVEVVGDWRQEGEVGVGGLLQLRDDPHDVVHLELALVRLQPPRRRVGDIHHH